MRITLTFLFSILVFTICAQPDTVKIKKQQYRSLSANYSSGKIIPTTDFVKGDNLLGKPLTEYQAYTFKMLWQNPGYTDWQKVYKNPYYGVGLSFSDFHNPTEIGYPVSAYGILGIPIKRWKKLELYSEFQFGIAFNWQKYDSITNPKNHVIGGGLTVHLNMGINAFYPITKNLDLGAGFSFIHFSNGGFERPNRGFNIYAPSSEIKYRFGDRPPVRDNESPGRLKRSNDLYLMLGYGDYQINEHELDTNYYAVGGISAIYFTQFSNAFRLGYGTDLNYWMGLTANKDGTMGHRNFDNLTMGLILQPEFIVGRLTLVSGFGIYAIHLNYGNFKQSYQRLGVRFDVYKDLSFGINVRSINFMLAEFLEFNMGYQFRWYK